MVSITNNLIEAIRDSLKDKPEEGFIPVRGVSGHYISLEERPNTDKMMQLFPVEVDGKKVFIYHEF